MNGTPAARSAAPPPPADRLATLLATGLGSGYAPLAPGSAGSLVGLALYWPMSRLHVAAQLLALAAVTAAGIWAAAAVARRLGVEDPGIVVVDEIAGMWVSLLLLPLTPFTAVAGFLLFRLLDVLKPFPAGRLERLPGGFGIIADDLMAGVYANLLLRALLAVWPL